MNFATTMHLPPTTDIVFPGDEEDLEAIFDRRTLKLIGSLHRRFWEKRRVMMKAQATSGLSLVSPEPAAFATPEIQPVVECGEVIADLTACTKSWSDRLEAYLHIRDEIDRDETDLVPPVVRIRGWEHTEPGLLVDGRAVPGCIVDIVVALSFGAERFRRGEPAFMFDIPHATHPSVAQLWADLFDLAQDRTGIERGTIVFGSVRSVTPNRRALAVA